MNSRCLWQHSSVWKERKCWTIESVEEKEPPLIFRACREVAAKGMFKASAVGSRATDPWNNFKKEKKNLTWQDSTYLIQYFWSIRLNSVLIHQTDAYTFRYRTETPLSSHKVYENIQRLPTVTSLCFLTVEEAAPRWLWVTAPSPGSIPQAFQY